MAYLVENEARIHSDILKDALEGFSNEEPDVTIVTEDDVKIFTQRIILSMYSNVMCNLLAEVKSSEIPSISLPFSSTIVLNLLKVLTEGMVLSDDPNCLREVGNAAQFLGITIEGMQLTLKEEIRTVTSEEPDISPKNHQIENLNVDDVSESFIKIETNELDTDISNLKSLIDQKKGQKKCNECNKVFTYTHVLNRHLLIHGEKQFNCDVCEKSFITSTLLKQHKIVHSGVKPFACKECDKVFAYTFYLKKHLSIHTGEKPFNCDGCEKSFRNSTLMKQHRIMHSEVKPFFCHCGSTFTTGGSLKRHQEKHN